MGKGLRRHRRDFVSAMRMGDNVMVATNIRDLPSRLTTDKKVAALSKLRERGITKVFLPGSGPHAITKWNDDGTLQLEGFNLPVAASAVSTGWIRAEPKVK